MNRRIDDRTRGRVTLALSFMQILVEKDPHEDPSVHAYPRELARRAFRLADAFVAQCDALGLIAREEGESEVDGPFMPEGAEAGE